MFQNSYQNTSLKLLANFKSEPLIMFSVFHEKVTISSKSELKLFDSQSGQPSLYILLSKLKILQFKFRVTSQLVMTKLKRQKYWIIY